MPLVPLSRRGLAVAAVGPSLQPRQAESALRWSLAPRVAVHTGVRIAGLRWREVRGPCGLGPVCATLPHAAEGIAVTTCPGACGRRACPPGGAMPVDMALRPTRPVPFVVLQARPAPECNSTGAEQRPCGWTLPLGEGTSE